MDIFWSNTMPDGDDVACFQLSCTCLVDLTQTPSVLLASHTSHFQRMLFFFQL